MNRAGHGVRVYEILAAAVTNLHNLGGLKEHTFILLQFWRAEVQTES